MERWQKFWSDKQDPLWGPPENDRFYERFGYELEALLAGQRRERVLEVGCGNGLLYRLLKLQAAGYTGLDYSQSMLDDFARRHPEARLVCADASRYRAEGRYDVIVSSGVLQYFDRPMLARHLALAASLLEPDGVLICGHLPWRSLRWRYLYGDLYASKRSGWLAMAARWLRYRLTQDPLGRWFEPQDLRQMAARVGLRLEVLGSIVMPYRFHACLRPL